MHADRHIVVVSVAREIDTTFDDRHQLSVYLG